MEFFANLASGLLSFILDVRRGSEYASVWNSLDNKDNSSWRPLTIFAEVLDIS